MALSELLPVLAQGGVTSVVLYIVYKLHVDAVRSHDQRASDWKAAYEREVARADVREQQLAHILNAVRQATGTETPS